MENNNDMNLEQNEEITAPETQSVEVKKAKFPLWVIPVAITVVIGIVMAIVLPGMFAEKTPEQPEISYGDYVVTVVDGLNNPMPNVVVKFTYPDGTTKSRITEADGVASIKNVELGDYKVTLEKGFSNAIIDVASYNLTEDNTSLKLVLHDETKTMEVYGAVKDGTHAYIVNEKSYNIPCVAGNDAYFVFNAHTTGIFRVSISDASDDVTVGYYGIPMFVQDNHRADGEYDGKTFEITIQDTATPYVFGIKSTSTKDVEFKIERIADAPFDPQFAPWKFMEKNSDVGKCDIPDETVLINFDVADKNVTVVERDGLYYTADGKPIYIRITTGNQAYLGGASLALIAGFVDDKIGMNIGGYIYDENGNFVEKRNYNSMIQSYMELCDGGYGVVPLTTELAECIKLHGENNHWWDTTSPNFIFGSSDIVIENAWLFLCMIEV